jgi:hypothetical protein
MKIKKKAGFGSPGLVESLKLRYDAFSPAQCGKWALPLLRCRETRFQYIMF